MKNLLFIILFILPPLSGAQTREANQATATLEKSALDFFELLQAGSRTREVPLTLEKSIEYSELIVRGYIDSVTEGRELKNIRYPILPGVKTAIMKIEVSRVIKGSRIGKYVYVEHIIGGIPPQTLHSSKYSGEILLMLVPATGFYKQDDQEAEVSKTAAPIVASNKLYQLLTPSRLFTIDIDDRHLKSPIGQGTLEESFYKAITSLDELETVIAQNMR